MPHVWHLEACAPSGSSGATPSWVFWIAQVYAMTSLPFRFPKARILRLQCRFFPCWCSWRSVLWQLRLQGVEEDFADSQALRPACKQAISLRRVCLVLHFHGQTQSHHIEMRWPWVLYMILTTTPWLAFCRVPIIPLERWLMCIAISTESGDFCKKGENGKGSKFFLRMRFFNNHMPILLTASTTII